MRQRGRSGPRISKLTMEPMTFDGRGSFAMASARRSDLRRDAERTGVRVPREENRSKTGQHRQPDSDRRAPPRAKDVLGGYVRRR